ncbi:MAG: transposase [Sphingomonadales bacterium]|nr:MAG: transposase [Sphingomonadales bacterium]
MSDEAPTQILNYRFKLLPTRGQHARLREALEYSRQLYNAGLEERIDCYRKTGRGLTFIDQCKALTELRADGSPWAATMERGPLKALHHTFNAFFKRGGFPRFKGKDWFKTISWAGREGWVFRDRKLLAKGLGAIRVHMHRPLPNQPVACRVKREGRHWYVILSVERDCAAANDNPSIGLDVGISSLAALSNGEIIANPRRRARAERETRRRARALARCKRGSRRRRKVKERLASWRAKERRARNAYLHQVSASLVRRFGVIAVEDLNVKGLAKSALARDVNDAAWGKLFSMLAYKAESAGCQIIKVDPRYTSQTCPECGEIKPKTLAERVHRCPCGCEMDRDVAAAKVILLRAVVSDRGVPNVAGYGERAPRMAVA